MTRLEIEQDVYRRIGYADAPQTPVVTRIRSFIDQRHRRLLSMPGLSRLRDTQEFFGIGGGGSPYAALPPIFSRVKKIRDLTNEITLEQRTHDWWRLVEPTPRQHTGIPTVWVPLGYHATGGPLLVPETGPVSVSLDAYSNDPTDTRTVTVEGAINNFNGRQVSVALTGTTPVLVAAGWTAVTDFVVNTPHLTAAVRLAATGTPLTTYAEIGPRRTESRYYSIGLWPTPSGAFLYMVDGVREIYDLKSDGDEPCLPPDFHYLLSVGARLDEYERMNDDRAVPLRGEWAEGLSNLKHWVINDDDFLIVPGGAPERRSRLGSWAPSGS